MQAGRGGRGGWPGPSPSPSRPKAPVGGLIYKALNAELTGTRVDGATGGETEASEKVTQPVSLKSGPEPKSPIPHLYPPCNPSHTLPCHPAPGPSCSWQQDAGDAKYKVPCAPLSPTATTSGWYVAPSTVPSDPAFYDILLPSTVTRISRK